MTEVVHCKSANEQGVQEAALLCSTKHMGRILEATPARLVVVVGGKTSKRFRWLIPPSVDVRSRIPHAPRDRQHIGIEAFTTSCPVTNDSGIT